MTKLTIPDAADKLGVSKEAIHNRIRRGSLQSVIEDGVKLVILSEHKSAQAKTANTNGKKTASFADERYYKLLEEQNAKLQQKVETLESETRSLRDQKEQMLLQEREKIEQIYKEKDEQLKNIINAISSKFILNAPDESFEAEIEHIQKEDLAEEKRLVSLSKYLKSKDFSKKKRLKIKEKFKAREKEDPRVIEIDKKYYIDLQKYDYSDFSL
ncbi:DNA-binding protein [Sulfurimonas sp.]|jgi:valyl-tRNA synthetase|uniref:DNA-binding protein n=1 Tax=Sulfurimonas sp. TaxID=2022749 RepID=UPI0025E8DEE4|nr:DNA-binding protein [Sulfurimonas sp.]MCK9473293.1 DNA-binding protein [Sulfurimonas sp.]MDD3504992.1 DNA-binding protein [Sulfurimonas sp.]